MQNVEAKFRVDDLDRIKSAALRLGFEPRGTMRQRDVFFHVTKGKLKLRRLEGRESGEIIYYRREDAGDLKISNYEIVAVTEPDRIRVILSQALGVVAEVVKERTLLMRGNIRMHLDHVRDLG